MIGINFLMKTALAKETKNIVEKAKQTKTKQNKANKQTNGENFLGIKF